MLGLSSSSTIMLHILHKAQAGRCSTGRYAPLEMHHRCSHRLHHVMHHMHHCTVLHVAPEHHCSTSPFSLKLPSTTAPYCTTPHTSTPHLQRWNTTSEVSCWSTPGEQLMSTRRIHPLDLSCIITLLALKKAHGGTPGYGTCNCPAKASNSSNSETS